MSKQPWQWTTVLPAAAALRRKSSSCWSEHTLRFDVFDMATPPPCDTDIHVRSKRSSAAGVVGRESLSDAGDARVKPLGCGRGEAGSVGARPGPASPA